MTEVLILLAHPHYQHSRLHRALIEAVATLPHVRVHDLYEMYPDFHIHVKHEKQAVLHSHTIVFQHPMRSFSAPSLLKEWVDAVLHRGWAYGGGEALRGKQWLEVLSTANSAKDFSSGGECGYELAQLMVPSEAAAKRCRMRYLSPLVYYRSQQMDDETLAKAAAAYRTRIRTLTGGAHGE